MSVKSIVFSYEVVPWDSDAPEDAGKDITLWTPMLEVYHSAQDAVQDRAGLDIVEGDLNFFAFDGSPLAANFSKEPYINSEKNTYFSGIYTLEPGTGKNLQTVLAERIAANETPQHVKIVVRTRISDEHIKHLGWPSLESMMEGVAEALTMLPPDLKQRIKFWTVPAAKH